MLNKTPDIVSVVQSVLRGKPKTIHDPFIDEGDANHVATCISRGQATGYGEIENLERRVAQLCGRKYALATSNGTAALHLAMMVAGVCPGDVVMMPSLNFVSAAAVTRYQLAFPYFTNGETDTDVQRVKARLQAIVHVDLLGHPCNATGVEAWAKLNNVFMIEDAAEALLSESGGRPCGSFGDISILSFNYNKIITTGGGGAFLTDDPRLYEEAGHLATTARVTANPVFFQHDLVGYNYRMPNICAALANRKLWETDLIKVAKQGLAGRYREAFADTPWRFVQADPGDVPNWWLNAVRCEGREARDQALLALLGAGIPARPIFTPLHTQGPYKRFPHSRDMQETEKMGDTILCLPSGAAI